MYSFRTPSFLRASCLTFLLALPATLLTLLTLLTQPAALAAQASHENLLPPALPWDGESRELVVAADDPWITPAERTGLTATPRYEETVAWLERLVEACPELRMISLGQSSEGRDIWMVIASKDRDFTPTGLKNSGKPTLFAHAAIHSGEIDGKDAGLMLLRDMTVRGTRAELLEKANFLFIPILSVDAHELFSRFHRINQRGPEEMGWRTNARNLNLNRDFSKLETREVQAVVEVLNTWDPDLYYDIHVTDGIDYQYDITWGFTGPHGYSPASSTWLGEVLRPAVDGALRAWGHIPGPLIFARDETDLTEGLVEWTPGIRFSNGLGDARHLPTVLVENHSLKPYDQRVLGTYVLLEATLATLGEHGGELRRAIEQDRARRPETLPLGFRPAPGEPPKVEFLGVAGEVVDSPVSGGPVVRWLGEPVTLTVPLLRLTEPALVLPRPKGYWVPPTYPEVIDKLRRHGIQLEITRQPVEAEVDMYELRDFELEREAFEGRVRVAATFETVHRRQRFPEGSAWVPTDQPLGTLACLLLEPQAEDSFFQWGYFLEILQRTEYVEAYVMEPMARRMLEEDPKLREAFEKKLAADPAFAADPRARLQWFYEKTPFYDQRVGLYPVGVVR
jgi:hypothetical protein